VGAGLLHPQRLPNYCHNPKIMLEKLWPENRMLKPLINYGKTCANSKISYLIITERIFMDLFVDDQTKNAKTHEEVDWPF
jgi:hypothetical protein